MMRVGGHPQDPAARYPSQRARTTGPAAATYKPGTLISREVKLYRVTKACKYPCVCARVQADVKSERNTDVGLKGAAFEICETFAGVDGNVYLKLTEGSKGHGCWVFLYDFEENTYAPILSKPLLEEIRTCDQLGPPPYEAMVKLDYKDPQSEGRTLDVEKGAIVDIKQANSDGWCLATNFDKKQGWLPKDYITRIKAVPLPAASHRESPAASQTASTWTVHKHNGKEYYYNIATKKTQWERPACLRAQATGGRADAQQGKAKPSPAATQAPTAVHMAHGGEAWQVHYHNGKPYYHNLQTNRTQWEKPKELLDHPTAGPQTGGERFPRGMHPAMMRGY